MNIRNLASKESLEFKLKSQICVQLCWKLVESNWYFCNITESRRFWKRLSTNKVSNNNFLKSVWKNSTFLKYVAELWTVFPNQVFKYQLPHTRFDQIRVHKHNIYLDGKLPGKLLAHTTNKNTNFMFTKTGRLCFCYIWFRKWLSGKILNKSTDWKGTAWKLLTHFFCKQRFI